MTLSVLSKKFGMLGLALVLALAILMLDIALPLGVAGAVPYVFIVLLGLWFSNRSQIAFITVIAGLLTVIGYYLSPEGGVFWIVIINRALALFVILATGGLLYIGKPKKETSGEPLPEEASKPVQMSWNPLSVVGAWGIGVALLTLASVIAIAFFVNKEEAYSRKWITHTHEVQVVLSDTLSLLQDMETGQRGYILTGDENYLEPFETAVKRLDSEMGDLKTLTKDNLNQQKNIEMLEPLIKDKVAELRQTITLRRNEGFDAALNVVRTDVGKQIMDQIRVIITKMNAVETGLLTERNERFRLLGYYSSIAYLLAVLLTIGVGIAVIIRLREFIVFRQKAETGLLESKEIAEKIRQQLAEKVTELNFQKVALDEHAIVSITDVKGNITHANEKFCSISGYTLDELIGNNHRMLKSDEHSPAFYDDLWRSIANGRPWHGEIRNLKKGGGDYWVNATIVPFMNDTGKPFQYVAIRTDITERKVAELDALKAKGEAEVANNAKSEFLSSMSHELRTPLNAILGFTQLLNTDPDHPLTGKQVDATEQVLKAGDHLLSLIEDVLDLAAIEVGKASLDPMPCDPSTAINDCVDIARALAEQRGLTFNDRTTGWNFPQINIDDTRFKQVLLNFLSNAVKYNIDGGMVSLALEETDDKKLRISVIDNGKGIPTEKQDEIFTPFSRLGMENSDITGTGIGLSITRELTEAMGGTIGFESRLNLGSTFWVEFPIVSGQLLEKDANEVNADADADADANTALQEKYTILCVEDNPASLKLLESIIERLPDTTMISAHTGELGVDLAEIHRPDAILMDINLPGITGLEALSLLRKSRITKDIPVIALTARASANDIKEGLDHGFDRYLIKPIKIAEITTALNQVLSGSQG